ncbi:MAG: RsmB/NOP family class I SAM-dependent RNA methyltransferase [Paenibacillaceae bacterium]|nr:RsmB/NOP family class I SAM-dependent RNA methyltransferase [Paenibacillaceae bacterium]
MQAPPSGLRLPPDFVRRTREQLGDDATQFLASYGEPRTQGLRLNPLKYRTTATAGDPLAQQLIELFGLTPVPWCEGGYYYDESSRPGKHPFHAAGLLYIQEPSAMSAAELLAPQPGDLVLDLAAAPGGKSTQIAGRLQGRGLLVANDIHSARAKILSENIERFGIANAVVTNAAPDKLAAKFPGFFTKIMLDAPCSGEGMFRKDPDAIAEWSEAHVAMCAGRQLDIARQALLMLKPGGTLAYSTCTFNREENEAVVAALLADHPGLKLVRTERIWPHERRGEGHFVAVLRSTGDNATQTHDERRGGKERKLPKPAAEAWAAFAAFARELAPAWRLPSGKPLLFGEQLYVLPADAGFEAERLDGLKVLRPGLHVATVRKGRIEPAHALALALHANDLPADRQVELAADDPAVHAYLRGESLPFPASLPGWTLVTTGGFPLGWGKTSNGELKNHYPKGLRIQ